MEYYGRSAEAMRLLHGRNFRDALVALRRLLHETHVSDVEYDDWLRGAADAYLQLEDPLGAGHIYLYLHYFDLAKSAFSRAAAPLDLAMALECQGSFVEAAELFQANRRPVQAAVNFEKGKRFQQARLLMEGVVELTRERGDPYAQALALLNLVHLKKLSGEPISASRAQIIEALRLLEVVADERESVSKLDEALDCYHLIAQVGQEQRAFENLSEGYLNAIRIHRSRGRLLTALRYYAGIASIGVEWGEAHAVATMLREASDAVRKAGTLYANYYLNGAAHAWVRAAEHNMAHNGPPEMSENALLAALDCVNQLNDAKGVSDCYAKLASLTLPEERLVRYRQLHAEAQSERRTMAPIYPPSELLRRPIRLLPLWRDDLVEWELGDDRRAIVKRIVWDLGYHDTVRRKALNLVLFALSRANDAASYQAESIELARVFAHLQPKLALRGLKSLLADPVAEVRAEAVRSAGIANNVAGLSIVEEALRDPDAGVRRAALEALGKHSYPEALDPLKRIYESFGEAEVQRVALAAIGKVRSFEAAEFIFRVFCAGRPEHVQAVAQQALSGALHPEWKEIFKSRLATETPEVKARARFLA